VNNSEKIEELIQSTADPVQRATLMVLSKIDTALDANTAATGRIAIGVDKVDATLKTHIHDEEVLLSSIQGGQKVGIALTGAIVLLAAYIINLHFSRNDTQDRDIQAAREVIQELKTNQQNVLRRLDTLERGK